MVNRIVTIYFRIFNKRFNSRFCLGSLVRHETPEESRRSHLPKLCDYDNDDEINSPNIISDQNDQASFQKFRQSLA